jgi:hypothetical protein
LFCLLVANVRLQHDITWDTLRADVSLPFGWSNPGAAQAIGICLEGRRLDQLRDIIIGSGKPLAALHYARTASSTVVHRAVRAKVIRLIVEIFTVLFPLLPTLH